MLVRAQVQTPHEVDANWLAAGVYDGEEGLPPGFEGTEAGALLVRLRASKDLSGSLANWTPILGAVGLKAGALAAVGLGPRDRFGPGNAFHVGVALGKRLGSKARDRVAVVLPDATDPAAIASALIEGVTVGTQGPDLRKAERSRQPFGELLVVAPPGAAPTSGDLDAALRRGSILGQAVNLARDLANAPPSDKPPTCLAARAREVAEMVGVDTRI